MGVSDWFARFYAPLAILAVLVTFLPLFEPQTRDGISVTWGSLWDMQARRGGAPAVLALLLIWALVVLLGMAAHRVRGPGLPIGIAALASVLLLMLWLEPGTGRWDPELAIGGVIGVALGLVALLLSVAHLVQLVVRGTPRDGR